MSDNQQPTHTSLIAEKAVIVSLSIKTWNPFRVDKSASEFVHSEKNAQPEAGRYNKRLIGKQYFEDLNALIREARNKYYYEVTLSWGKAGDRLLPAELMAEFIVKMDEFKSKFKKGILQIAELIPNAKIEAQGRLGDMYVESEYISKDEAKRLVRKCKEIGRMLGENWGENRGK